MKAISILFISKQIYPVLFLFLFGVLSIVPLNAQKNITTQHLVWYAYTNMLQLNKQWSLQTEIHERHYIAPTAQHQFLVRSQIRRALGNSGWDTSLGLCLFWQSPNDPKASPKPIIPEVRPHVEFTYKQKLPHFTLDHRYRAEARFFHHTDSGKTHLEDGYGWGNFRFRYRLQATIPVWKIRDNSTLKIKIGDEILINADKKITATTFDQNRIYIGLSADIGAVLTLDLGYLNWFQQRSASDFYNRHILQLAVLHKITLNRPPKS